MKEILFQLDPNLPATLQAQLREKVVNAILSRALQPGERLPSSRGLAKHLGIARNTVTLAYQALVDDGYLSPKARSGFVVNEEAPAHPPKPETHLRDQKDIDWSARLVSSENKLNIVRNPLNWREFKYPFVYGQADFDLFGHSEWRDCARQALGARDFGSLAGDFGDHDDPLLLNHIASHSLPQRGIYVEPDSILVTLGAQNALFIITELLIDEETRVVLEEPCYPDVRNIVAQRTSNIASLPVDSEGLVPDESVLSKCDYLFITPSHQCPTTATMPTARRRELLELAEKYDFIIVEDDYEFEMNFLAAPLPALKTLDAAGRVIYVGSFSKSLFPGLRLGYLVASQALVTRARQLRHLMFRHPPGHTQRTVAYFMALGHYGSQMRRRKKVFAERRRIMAAALEKYGLVDTSAAHFGGTSFWIRGPQGLNTEELALRLSGQSVLIEPGAPFFKGAARETNYFRAAYSSIPANRIEAGVELTAAEIAKMVN